VENLFFCNPIYQTVGREGATRFEDSSARKTGVLKYPDSETIGPFHVERKGQGEYPMVAVLHGAQYREANRVWICG